MKRQLIEIIEKHLEGNYLVGRENKAKIISEILVLFNVSVSSVSRDEAEDFLQSKDIFNHPVISDRTESNGYEVADLMAEFYNTTNSR